MSDAQLINVEFNGANLSNANLSNADLERSSLNNTDLNNAYLYRSKLYMSNLTGVKGLTEEQLSRALLCRTELPEEYKSLSSRDRGEFILLS